MNTEGLMQNYGNGNRRTRALELLTERGFTGYGWERE
jgi:hypothetical protein